MEALVKIEIDNLSDLSDYSYSSCDTTLKEDLEFREQNLAYMKEIEEKETAYNREINYQQKTIWKLQKEELERGGKMGGHGDPLIEIS